MQSDQLPGTFFGPSTLVELLRHRVECQADDVAFYYLVDGESDEVQITYRELDRQARAIAAWLEGHGLTGERALLLYPAGLEFIAAFYGCLYAGVVAVPVYPPRRNRSMMRIQAIADDCQAKVALTTDAVLSRVEPIIDETPHLKDLTWLATCHVPAGTENAWRMPDIHSNTLAFLQYTSGSTGTPKGVVLNHANLMHNSALIAYFFEHTRSGLGVFWLPSYHDMGLIGGILQPMYVGRPNVLMSPMSFLQKPYRWLAAISRYGGSTSGGPNFAYDLCVQKITPEQRKTLDLSTWTVAFNGAEPVRAETLDAFCEVFAPCGFRREAFYPCYGLAEATLMVAGGYAKKPPILRSFDARALTENQVLDVPPDGEGVREMVGCGNTMRDQQIVIVDPETLLPCPADRVGEIWVKGPSVAQGYWQQSEATQTMFQARLQQDGAGPFLRTGDLGFLRDGELFVTGRLKDLIIFHGVNHYPQDIELTVAESNPRLRRDCGAAFTLEVEGHEQLVLVQEIERHKQGNLDQIYNGIRRAVSAEHDLPVDIIVLIKAGSIPKTSSGKIQRHACRRAYLDGTLEVVGQWQASPSASGVVLIEKPEVRFPGSKVDRPEELRGQTAAAEGPRPTEILSFPRGERWAERPAQVASGNGGTASKEATAAAGGNGNSASHGGPGNGEASPKSKLDPNGTVFDEEPRGNTAETNSAAIPSEYHTFALFPEYRRLRHRLERAEDLGLGNPCFTVHQGVSNHHTVIAGRELLNYSSYNYLGMSGDPLVSQAAKDAIDRYGTSVSASRLVSGEKEIHGELERAIADFLGTEAAMCFVGGHATNETTIGHLVGAGDLVLHDALSHNSVVQGALLSGARRRTFAHNDWQMADDLLRRFRREYRRVLLLIEGVYSMDGDIPDLPWFVEVKKRHRALLMIDEAHSAGTIGARGQGIAEYHGIDRHDVDVWMGTLSKSLGSCGGYVAGCPELIEYLKYTAPGFVYSVGLPPAAAAAAQAALRLLEAEPERVVRLQRRARLFLSLARERGLDTGLSKDSPIVPVILGNSTHSLLLAKALFARGINVQPLLHPAVEERTARLRFFITALHTEEQIRQTLDAVVEELQKVRIQHPRQFDTRSAMTL